MLDSERVAIKTQVCGVWARSVKLSLFVLEADGSRTAVREHLDNSYSLGASTPVVPSFDFERDRTYVVEAVAYAESDAEGAEVASLEARLSVFRKWPSAKVTPDDPQFNDRFGNAVAISGDLLVAGSYNEDAGGNIGFDSGSVYVFRKRNNRWTQVAKLTADDSSEDNGFGVSVALSGSTVVVGALLNDIAGKNNAGKRAGSAYVFTSDDDGDSWTQVTKLVPDDTARYDEFGVYSLAISNNIIVVGAPGDDETGTDVGSAYVYKRDDGGQSWLLVRKLRPADAVYGDGKGGDTFGQSVAVVAENNQYVIVVGAPGGGDGAAYVFDSDDRGQSWRQVAKFTPSDAVRRSFFGRAVAVSSGHAIAVGSPNADSGEEVYGGAAYVYQKQAGTNKWVEAARLTAGDATEWDEFGLAVDISGDRVVVGAWYDGDGGFHSGSAYVFQRHGATWPLAAKLTAPDGAPTDRFGWAVAIDGTSVVAGCQDDDDVTNSAYYFDFTGYYQTGSNSGAAYVFSL